MPTGISIVYRTSYYAINTWKQVGSFNAHLRKCTATYAAFAHEVTQCRLQNRRITNVATKCCDHFQSALEEKSQYILYHFSDVKKWGKV